MEMSFRHYKNFLKALDIVLVVSALMGCGYHFRSTGTPIGTDIRSLAIPLITSPSSSLGFEGEFTRIVREEFMSHAKVPLVPRGQAAAILIGRVYEINIEPLSYGLTQQTVNGQVTTYEVTNTRWLRLKLDARLVDRATGKVIWEDRSMKERAVYAIGTDPLENRYNQREAIKGIARKLATRLYSKTMERF